MRLSDKLNVLVAYPYLKKEEVEIVHQNQDCVNLLIDSGAFTAWKKGSTIEVSDYSNFLKTIPFTPWGAFTLDVVGNPEKSMENYKKLLDLGHKCIPIFTRGENPSVIDEYYKTSDIIALGGLVGTKGNKGFVNGIMDYVAGRKVHWLGFTNQDFLQYYKPYSCDSSSWASGLLYGNLKLYDSFGKFHVITKKILVQGLPDRVKDLLADKYKFDYKRLQNKEEWTNKQYTSALRDLTFRSSARYYKDIVDQTGINYFFAMATSEDIRDMIAAFKEVS